MKTYTLTEELVDHLDGLMDDDKDEGGVALDTEMLGQIAERYQKGETTQEDIKYLSDSLAGKHDTEVDPDPEPEADPEPETTEPEEPEPTPAKATKKAAKPKATKKAKTTKEPKKARPPSPITALIQGAAAGAKVVTKQYPTSEEAFTGAYAYWGARRRLGLQAEVGIHLDRAAKTVTVGPREAVDALIAEEPPKAPPAKKTAKKAAS